MAELIPIRVGRGRSVLRGRWLLRVLRIAVLAVLAVAAAVTWGQTPTFQLAPVMTTIAGGYSNPSGFPSFGSGDGGLAIYASLARPYGVATDSFGNVYFTAYQNHTVRKINAVTGIISTVAGAYNSAGYSGDGGPASASQLNQPWGIAIDAANDIYVADSGNNVVREIVAATGNIQTVAGTYQTYGGPTTQNLYTPTALAIDGSGLLYIADTYNSQVRVLVQGNLVAFAGTGLAGFGGDGGPATSANLTLPQGLAFDPAGNLYIADTGNYVVRRVDAKTGTITTVAGTPRTPGNSGDSGLATAATFQSPRAVAADAAGNLYIGDDTSYAVHRVDSTTGVMTLYAGSGGQGYYPPRDETAAKKQIGGARGLAVDASGNLLIADGSTGFVEKVYQSDQITFPLLFNNSITVSSETIGVVVNKPTAIGTPTIAASLNGTQEFTYSFTSGCAVDGVTINPAGSVCYLAVQLHATGAGTRYGTLQIPQPQGATTNFGLVATGQYAQVGVVPSLATTIAGRGPAQPGYYQSGFTFDQGLAITAPTNAPYGMAADANGNVYFADTENNVVREIDTSGHISTVAGSGQQGYSGDGRLATAAALNKPTYIAIDAAQYLYISDSGNNAIRRVALPSGTINSVVGNGTSTAVDGVVPLATGILNPQGLALDALGNLYFADSGNHMIRKLDMAEGLVHTIVGTGATGSYAGSGPALGIALANPSGVAVDSSGNLFFADTGHHVIRELPAGSSAVQTYAGLGQQGGFGDGLPPIEAEFSSPTAVAVNAAGDVYVSDTGNGALRKIEKSGNVLILYAGVETSQGNFSQGFGASGQSSTATQLFNPHGLAFDSNQNLYVADTGNNVIRKIFAAPGLMQFPSTAVGSSSGEYSIWVENIGNSSLSFASPAAAFANSVTSSNFTMDLERIGSCGHIVAAVPGFPSLPSTVAAGNHCTIGSAFAPTQSGFVFGEIDVTDSSLAPGTTSTQPIYLNGGAAPAVTLSPAAVSAPVVSQAYSATISASGGVGGLTIFTSGSVPAGLSFAISGNNVNITGTPSNTSARTLTVLAQDSIGQTATVDYLIAPATQSILQVMVMDGVTVNDTPVVQLPLQVFVTDGVSVNDSATVVPPLQVLVMDGVSVSDAPTETQSVQVSVADGVTVADSVSITFAPLTVSPASGALLSGVVGQSIFPINIQALGGTPPYTYSGLTPPPGLQVNTVSSNGVNSLVLSGIPTAKGQYALTVTATDATGAKATQNYSMFIDGISQSILPRTSPQTANYGDAKLTLDFASSSGLPVTYKISGPISGFGPNFNITGAGTATIQVTQAGDTAYNAAIPIQWQVTIAKAPLTLTPGIISRPFGKANPASFPYTISGLVNGDGANVVKGVTGSYFTLVTGITPPGRYSYTPNLFGLTAANYTISAPTGEFDVTSGAAQTITFVKPPNLNHSIPGQNKVHLVATASSGLPVSYTVTGPATLSGGYLTATGAGTITVTASQAGNASYAAAPTVTRSITAQ